MRVLRSTLGLLVVLALLVPAAASAKPWQSYVLAPAAEFRKPVRVVSVEGDVQTPEALVTGEGTATLNYPEGGTPPAVVLDFGQDTGGFPQFVFASHVGTPTLRSSYSETIAGLSADGDYAGKTRLTRVQEHPITVDGPLRSTQIEGGQRYMRLALSTPGTLTLSEAGIVYTGYPGTAKNLRGWFLSSDDLLNRIWYAGVYTVNLNQVQPGLRQLPGQLVTKPAVLDGGKRDRRVWSGDLLISGKTVYSALDPAYLKGSLSIIANHPVADDGNVITRELGDINEPGPLPGVCSPNQKGGTGCRFYSATYSMAFVPALAEYLRYTGDLAFVKAEWRAVLRQMAWNARHVDENGLLVIDEQQGDNWNLELFPGELTYVNSMYHLALTSAAELADALEPGSKDGKVFRRRARRIKDIVNRRLWDPSRGLYDMSTTEREPVVQDANVFAIISGIAAPDQADQALTTLQQVLANPFGMLNVSEPFPEGFRPVVSPYMNGFHLQALFDAHRDDEALALMRLLWGWMIDHDPGNTMWERVLPDGRLTHRASAAHSWSTAPTSALSHYVLGPSPTTAGWATWDVTPHRGDLAWARGSVPTPRGPLEVSWRQGDHPLVFTLDVKAPKGTIGTVRVPLLAEDGFVKLDGEVILEGGEDVRHDDLDVTIDGDYLEIPDQAGEHRYRWTTKRRG